MLIAAVCQEVSNLYS